MPLRTRRDFGRAFVAVAAGGAMVACQANPFAQGSDDQPLRTFLWNFDTLDPAFTTGALEAEYEIGRAHV